MTLDFHQIVYKKEQVSDLYDFANVYVSSGLTAFFENAIISGLVPLSNADYISVCSWKLRRKRLDGWTPMLCGFAGKPDDLSEEKILSQDADVMVLTPRTTGHQMLTNAARWHGGPQHNYAWDNAMTELKKFIKVPIEVKTAIYENHFIARKQIYHEYVTDCLNPVMRYMSDKDVFLSDSGYAAKKARTNPAEVERYRKETGRRDWPIATFILERLFSIWINAKQFKIINI